MHTAAYNVQYGAIEVLEVKFISVITGEKHFSSSETTASFTVPIGITKIKVDADCLIADAPFEEDVSYAISVINNSTKKYGAVDIVTPTLRMKVTPTTKTCTV